MRCPNCGSEDIKKAIVQEVYIKEFWSEGERVGWDAADFGDELRVVGYKCIDCETQEWVEDNEDEVVERWEG